MHVPDIRLEFAFGDPALDPHGKRVRGDEFSTLKRTIWGHVSIKRYPPADPEVVVFDIDPVIIIPGAITFIRVVGYDYTKRPNINAIERPFGTGLATEGHDQANQTSHKR